MKNCFITLILICLCQFCFSQARTIDFSMVSSNVCYTVGNDTLSGVSVFVFADTAAVRAKVYDAQFNAVEPYPTILDFSCCSSVEVTGAFLDTVLLRNDTLVFSLGTSTMNIDSIYIPMPESGYWAANGDSIYNTNSDNVGIGTMSPTRKLFIDGDFGMIARKDSMFVQKLSGADLTGFFPVTVGLGHVTYMKDDSTGFQAFDFTGDGTAFGQDKFYKSIGVINGDFSRQSTFALGVNHLTNSHRMTLNLENPVADVDMEFNLNADSTTRIKFRTFDKLSGSGGQDLAYYELNHDITTIYSRNRTNLKGDDYVYITTDSLVIEPNDIRLSDADNLPEHDTNSKLISLDGDGDLGLLAIDSVYSADKDTVWMNLMVKLGGNETYYMPMTSNCTLVDAYAVTYGLLAASDTINIHNNSSVLMGNGTIIYGAATIAGTVKGVSPSSNNKFLEGEKAIITTNSTIDEIDCMLTLEFVLD